MTKRVEIEPNIKVNIKGNYEHIIPQQNLSLK